MLPLKTQSVLEEAIQRIRGTWDVLKIVLFGARGNARPDSDLNAARAILSGDGPYDTACFHIEFWPDPQAASAAIDIAQQLRSKVSTRLQTKTNP